MAKPHKQPRRVRQPEWVKETRKDKTLKFVTREWRKAAAVPGSWYDHDLAEKIVELWPVYFRHTEGRWAGKPFILTCWQAAIVRLLVGWKGADGFRLYRRLILWVGRKNGKSEFIAALTILFFLFDGEMGGQAYSMASTEKQAKIVFEKAKKMVLLSTALSPQIQAFRKSMYCPELMSVYELLSGKAEGKHGLSASVIAGDEIHEWKDENLYTTLHQSVAARDQPIELLGSTAGYRGRGYGWTMWEECRGIEEGRLVDPSTMVVIFAAGADDDWTDEKVWAKANPNLGISPKLEYLQAECAKAKDNPRLEANFRRYHLNQWVENAIRWIPTKRWDACKGALPWQELEAHLQGRECFGGLDLATTRDVAAVVWYFPPTEDDPVGYVLPRFFVPEDTVEERVRRDRVEYDRWVASGAMFATPGNVVDQDFIKNIILKDTAQFNVQGLGYDVWNAVKIATELQENGLRMFIMRQGIPTLGAPSKEFERLIYGKKIQHGGEPVLRWMMGNVVLLMDSNANFRPNKEKSSEKIDGVVAAIMALGMSMEPGDGIDLDEFLSSPVIV